MTNGSPRESGKTSRTTGSRTTGTQTTARTPPRGQTPQSPLRAAVAAGDGRPGLGIAVWIALGLAIGTVLTVGGLVYRRRAAR